MYWIGVLSRHDRGELDPRGTHLRVGPDRTAGQRDDRPHVRTDHRPHARSPRRAPHPAAPGQLASDGRGFRRGRRAQGGLIVDFEASQQLPQAAHLHLQSPASAGHRRHEAGGIGQSGEAEAPRVPLDLVQQARQAADHHVVRAQRRHLLDHRVNALELGRKRLEIAELGLLPGGKLESHGRSLCQGRVNVIAGVNLHPGRVVGQRARAAAPAACSEV